MQRLKEDIKKFLIDNKDNELALRGHNTGETIRLGDEVHVIVGSVDIEKKIINFTLLR